jgi:hypothetical protein
VRPRNILYGKVKFTKLLKPSSLTSGQALLRQDIDQAFVVSQPLKGTPLQYVAMAQHSLNAGEELLLMHGVVPLCHSQLGGVEGSN